MLTASLYCQEAGGRWPAAIPFGGGARLQGVLPLGSGSDLTVLLFLPPQGFWKHWGCQGGGGGTAAASRRCGPAWHTEPLKVRQTAAGPRPGPFFTLLFVQALLIWEQGPFMWRRAWPGLASPPRAGDFLFIWHWEPRAWSETAGGIWWCHKTWVTQLSVGHCGLAALIFSVGIATKGSRAAGRWCCSRGSRWLGLLRLAH